MRLANRGGGQEATLFPVTSIDLKSQLHSPSPAHSVPVSFCVSVGAAFDPFQDGGDDDAGNCICDSRISPRGRDHGAA